MNEQQEPNEEEQLEDLEVTEEAAEDVGGGRNPPGGDPIPIPYPN